MGQTLFPQPQQERTLGQSSSDSVAVSFPLVLTMTSLHVPRCLGHLTEAFSSERLFSEVYWRPAPCLSPSCPMIFFPNIFFFLLQQRKKKLSKKAGLEPPQREGEQHNTAAHRHGVKDPAGARQWHEAPKRRERAVTREKKKKKVASYFKARVSQHNQERVT